MRDVQHTRDELGLTRVRQPRLSKRERRSQLLEVARDVVLRRGAAGMTMELLAEEAGVSKALPYAHFDNIDDVLITIYRREGRWLGDHIWTRLEDAAPDADLVKVHISAYFEGMARSGRVFGALTVPGMSIAAKADPRSEGPRFTARVLRTFHGVDKERARVLGPVVNATVTMMGDTWCRGLAPRDVCADLAEHQMRAALAWEESHS